MESRYHNQLLSRLGAADLALIARHLEFVELPVRTRMEKRGGLVEHVYFMNSGMASVVAVAGNHLEAEVAILGKEGMTGLGLIHGVRHSAHEVYMQVGGNGWRLPAAALLEVMDQSDSMRAIFLAFAHAAMVQMSFSVVAAARQTLQQRLSRWLLMAEDRIGSTELALTHEFLALMLGVRRPGVTVALGNLVSQGLIETERGLIIIRDRAELQRYADATYGAPEAEYRRVLETAEVRVH